MSLNFTDDDCQSRPCPLPSPKYIMCLRSTVPFSLFNSRPFWVIPRWGPQSLSFPPVFSYFVCMDFLTLPLSPTLLIFDIRIWAPITYLSLLYKINTAKYWLKGLCCYLPFLVKRWAILFWGCCTGGNQGMTICLLRARLNLPVFVTPLWSCGDNRVSDQLQVLFSIKGVIETLWELMASWFLFIRLFGVHKHTHT